MIPTLDIIIVNWNSGNLIAECIKSIHYAVNNSFKLNKIVVVDNASTDNSINQIKVKNLPIKIIKNSNNIGFGRACNQGARDSIADYLLFLNPDTRLFKDSLNVPIGFMEDKKNNNIGIVGVKMIDENNNIYRHCSRFPTPLSSIYKSLGFDKVFPKIFKSHFMTEWDHNSNRIVDQVIGAFFLIRKSLFEKVGGYDERFFVYYEDLDLAFRIKKLGFFSFYLSNAKVFHKGNGTTQSILGLRTFYNLNSKLVYSKKHFNSFYYILIFITVMFGEPISRTFFLLSKRKFKDIYELSKGYMLLWKKIVSNIRLEER